VKITVWNKGKKYSAIKECRNFSSITSHMSILASEKRASAFLPSDSNSDEAWGETKKHPRFSTLEGVRLKRSKWWGQGKEK